MEWFNTKPQAKKKRKKTKSKIGETKFFSNGFPSYLTSHTKPQRLRSYAASKKKLSRMDKVSINPFLLLGKPKKISKRDLSWPQAKRRFPLLHPMKDTDKDGVINLLDCKPFDRKRQDKKLKRIKVSKYKVLRFVDEEDPTKITIVPSGVDDPKSSFLKEKGKYPKQEKYHKEFLEKKEPEYENERKYKSRKEVSAQKLIDEDFNIEDEDDITLDLPDEKEEEEEEIKEEEEEEDE